MSTILAVQIVGLVVILVMLGVVLHQGLFVENWMPRFKKANKTKYRVKTVRKETNKFYSQIKLNMFVPWATIELNSSFNYDVYYGSLPSTGYHETFKHAEQLCQDYKKHLRTTSGDQKVSNTIVCEDD